MRDPAPSPHDTDLWQRAQGLDPESQLHDAIDRDADEALARCPAARAVITRAVRALRRRLDGLARARRQLRAIGRRRDGAHGR
jgi:hypothetical protein